MKIEICDNKTSKTLLKYESDIIPNVGDEYPSLSFEDRQQRKIVRRLLFPSVPNCINVYVDNSFPSLVELEKTKLRELSETEATHAIQLMGDGLS